MTKIQWTRSLMRAALLLPLFGLVGCAGAGNACYEAVEREYGQVMMPVPCPENGAEDADR